MIKSIPKKKKLYFYKELISCLDHLILVAVFYGRAWKGVLVFHLLWEWCSLLLPKNVYRHSFRAPVQWSLSYKV